MCTDQQSLPTGTLSNPSKQEHGRSMVSSGPRPQRGKYYLPWERAGASATRPAEAETPTRKPPPRFTGGLLDRTQEMMDKQYHAAGASVQARKDAMSSSSGQDRASTCAAPRTAADLGDKKQMAHRQPSNNPPAASFAPAYTNNLATAPRLLDDPFEFSNHPLRQKQPKPPTTNRSQPFEQVSSGPLHPESRFTPSQRGAPYPGPQLPQQPLPRTDPRFVPCEPPRAQVQRLGQTITTKSENAITRAIHSRLLISSDTFGAELLGILSTVCQYPEKATFLLSNFPVAEGEILARMTEQEIRAESQFCLGQASGFISLVYELSGRSMATQRLETELFDVFRRMWEHDARARSESDLLRLQEYLAQQAAEEGGEGQSVATASTGPV